MYVSQTFPKISITGDAGYGLKPYLITPFRSTSDGSRERIFNNKHAKARNIIERTIGLLKNRYRCLIDKLHYNPEKATQIINVCCALHNMCVLHNVDLDVDVTATLSDMDEPSELADDNMDAQRIRMQIVNSIC